LSTIGVWVTPSDVRRSGVLEKRVVVSHESFDGGLSGMESRLSASTLVLKML
jgi:hypothetical protein